MVINNLEFCPDRTGTACALDFPGLWITALEYGAVQKVQISIGWGAIRITIIDLGRFRQEYHGAGSKD